MSEAKPAEEAAKEEKKEEAAPDKAADDKAAEEKAAAEKAAAEKAAADKAAAEKAAAEKAAAEKAAADKAAAEKAAAEKAAADKAAAEKAAAEQAEAEQAAAQAAAKAKAAKAQSTAARGKLLLVAWGPSSAGAWESSFAGAGFEVYVERDARLAAFQWANENQPVAIVIDLSQNPDDGKRLATTLRITGSTAAIPMVFCDAAGGGAAPITNAEAVLGALSKL